MYLVLFHFGKMSSTQPPSPPRLQSFHLLRDSSYQQAPLSAEVCNMALIEEGRQRCRVCRGTALELREERGQGGSDGCETCIEQVILGSRGHVL